MIRIIKLAPSQNQKMVLDSLFSGPEKVISFLENDRPELKGEADILLYLLSKKTELYLNLRVDSWEYYVDFLKTTAKNYIDSGDDLIETELVPDCSISAEYKVYVPLDGLRLIECDNPEDVKKAVKNWSDNKMIYKNSFSIVKKVGNYYCQIELAPMAQGRKKIHVKAKKPKQRICVDNLSIAKLCRLIAASQLALSKAYSRVDFDRIQGRSVQGGAVELGKKR